MHSSHSVPLLLHEQVAERQANHDLQVQVHLKSGPKVLFGEESTSQSLHTASGDALPCANGSWHDDGEGRGARDTGIP